MIKFFKKYFKKNYAINPNNIITENMNSHAENIFRITAQAEKFCMGELLSVEELKALRADLVIYEDGEEKEYIKNELSKAIKNIEELNNEKLD